MIDKVGPQTGETFTKGYTELTDIPKDLEGIRNERTTGRNDQNAGSTDVHSGVRTGDDSVSKELNKTNQQYSGEEETDRMVQYQTRIYEKENPNVRDMDIDRTYIAYEDIKTRNEAETIVADSLISRGAVTDIPEETASKFIKATDWSNRYDSRNCIRAILKTFIGESVYFFDNGKNGAAYLTGKGIGHALSGANTEKKALSLENFRILIKNAEYAYSGKNDHGSIFGKVDWDYFVSVAKIGDTTIPFVFAVRTIDDDFRSQIYSIATKENSDYLRGDAKQNNNSAIVHPNSYEELPSSDVSISYNDGFVNAQNITNADNPFGPDGDIQYSQRVDDEALVQELESNPVVTVYRAMQVIDGKLYPPMAAKVKDQNGKNKLVEASEFGVWYQATEQQLGKGANGSAGGGLSSPIIHPE